MSILPLQTKSDFIENVVILSFGLNPPLSPEERNSWIRKRLTRFQNLSQEEIDDLILLSNTIPTLEKAEEKFREALNQQDLNVRMAAETEATKRKELEETEATKRKVLEETEATKRKVLEETEATKRKVLQMREVEIRETNETKRQKMKYDQPSSSVRYDSTFNYYTNLWSGNGSFITPFEAIFSCLELPEYTGIVFLMPWVAATCAKEEDYQTHFNTFLTSFGTSTIDKEKLVIHNSISSLHYRDTHSSPDGLLGLKKPDTTIYLSNPNGADPGPSPLKLCFLIELQLKSYDSDHAIAIIQRSELAMKRVPNRTHLFTLWLTQHNLAVHKVERGSDGFIHSFSTTVSFSDTLGVTILHFFLNQATPTFFGVPVFSQEIENYLQTNDLFAFDFLGSGTYSNVFKISNLDHTINYALKVYKNRDEKHLHLRNQEVKILNLLSEFVVNRCQPGITGITGVPSIVREADNWILLNKVFSSLTFTANILSFHIF
jgi:hypothetical protein